MIMIVLIVSPPVRKALFPTAPIALVDSISGGLTKPNSGILGSHDSITGAPENMPGEAVESEAANFVTTLAGIGTNLMTGEDPAGEPNPPEQAMKSPFEATPGEVDILSTLGTATHADIYVQCLGDHDGNICEGQGRRN